MKKKTPKKTPRKIPPQKKQRLSAVLAPDEPKPVRVENPQGRGLGLIICDHAGNRVPRALKDMGLEKATLKKHIAWDIGAEDISRHMSKALDMPAVLAVYSRLVADMNRAPDYHECMAEVSDRIKIPANAALSKEAKELRLKEVHRPYQNRIGKLVEGFVKKGRTPVLVAVHSFTPEMDGVRRPWHISILWNKEEKIAKQVVRALRRNHPDLLVGENEPYSLLDERFAGSTICRHAEERNLPYVFVEFRQDLVDTREKAVRWADIFLQALQPVLEGQEIFRDRKIKPFKK